MPEQTITIHVCRNLILALLFTMATATTAAADLYQYTDKHGTVCMTNNLDNVPAAKRKGVKVIREEPKRIPPVTSTTNDPSGQPEPAAEPPTSSHPAPPLAAPPSLPWAKVATGGTVLLLLFFVTRLARSLSSPQFAKVIYVAFFLGTFVLGYKLYADHLVNGYFAIKGKFLTLFAKAQLREGLATPRSRTGESEP